MRTARGVGLALTAAATLYGADVARRLVLIALRLGAEPGDAGRTTVVRPFGSFRNTANGPLRDGLLMTFSGGAGAVWAWAWAAALGGAVCVVLFARTSRVRAAAVVALAIGVSPWGLNAAYMSAVGDPEFLLGVKLYHAAGLFLSVLAACWGVFARSSRPRVGSQRAT